MKITIYEKEKIVIFRLKGRVISPSIKKVLETVDETIAGRVPSPKLVFDFKEVTQINSAGLGMLTKIYIDILPHEGKIALINTNKHIRDVIIGTRLSAVLKCFKSEEDAVDALLQHP